MSRKPRLVHQGSPIEGNESNSYHRDDAVDAGTHQLSNSAQLNQAPAPKKFKLQTRLVVGTVNDHRQNGVQNKNDDEDSLDAMMTDGDEHDIFDTHHHQQQDQSHFSYSQNQQHFQHTQSYQQPIHNEPVHTQPARQIYHMPAPSTSPLVVIDGANISYAYAESLNPSLANHSGQHQGREPNPRGITLAIQYFLKHQCRVQAVVPISWYKLKPRQGDHFVSGGKFNGNLNHRDDAKMVTEEVEELRTLRQHGFLVPCPPGDDDDAYALALARREEERLSEQHGTTQSSSHEEVMMVDDDTTLSCLPMGGYVVSNDFFHDAVRRDEWQQKQHHQLEEQHFQQTGASSLSSRQSSHRHMLKAWLKKHRISYSFANVGLEVDGHIELEFLPNPRNELVEAIDAHTRLHQNNNH
jgi:hypothetical protein